MSFFSRARSGLPILFVLLMVSASVAQAVDFIDFTSSVYTGPHKVKAIDTTHFTVEYSNDVAVGQDDDGDGIPNLVESIATYAEFSWDKEVTELGLPNPLENYANYEHGVIQERIYLILDDTDFYLLPGSVGSTSLMTDQSIYFAVDPSISDDLLKVTVAHEFFHVIQFSYQGDFIGFDQDLNFAEQTAVAVEDYVYDDVNDYWNYLHHYFDYPDYSILTGIIPEDSLFEYGLTIWPRFLVEYFDDWDVLPKVIKAYFAEPIPDVWDSFEAYQQVVEEDYGANLNEVYQDFSLWNYLLGYYEEGGNYPRPVVHSMYYSEDYPLSDVSPVEDFLPALFGTNYLQFYVGPSEWGKDLKLTFNKSSNIALGVMVLPETEEDYLVDEGRAIIFEEGDDSGTVTIPIADQINVFTIMVSPLSKDPSQIESPENAFSIGYNYTYSAEIGDFIEGSEIQMASLSDGGLSDGETIKSGDEVGQNSPEGNADLSAFDELTVHELDITSHNDTSVSLSWSRVQGNDVAGYRVYYGYESGSYLFSKEVNGAHITHLTVRDLLSMDDYFFTVKGLNTMGDESNAFSNEVSVTLGSTSSDGIGKEFPDVPMSNKYHDAIGLLTEIKVFSGYPDGTFQPNKTLNRAELMKILAISDLKGEDTSTYRDCFPDVTDEWFAPYVCYGASLGWIQGYTDGLFHPERIVSRAEALKIIFKSADTEIPSFANVRELPYEDVFGSAWFAPYVVEAYNVGLLENIGATFGPNQGQTRGQVAEIIYRYFVVLWFNDDEPYTQELGDQFQIDWVL